MLVFGLLTKGKKIYKKRNIIKSGSAIGVLKIINFQYILFSRVWEWVALLLLIVVVVIVESVSHTTATLEHTGFGSAFEYVVVVVRIVRISLWHHLKLYREESNKKNIRKKRESRTYSFADNDEPIKQNILHAKSQLQLNIQSKTKRKRWTGAPTRLQLHESKQIKW